MGRKMMILEQTQSKPQRIALINGILPLILTVFFLFASSNYFFTPGYFLYGWIEILGLSAFVSIVPEVAHWFFFGISIVGAEATANLTITLIALAGSLLILYGYLQSRQKDPDGVMKGRNAWLIGGILTLPLGLLAIIAFRNSKAKKQDLSLRERVVGELRKNKLPYILIIPALIFLIFTYIIPIIRGFYITLFSYPSGSGGLARALNPVDYTQDPLLWTIHAILGGLQRQDPIFVGVDNYLELFSQTTRATSFQNALDNNIFFVIIFVPGVIILSLALAVLLNNKLLKGENTYTTIFYMPVVTSVLVVSVIWLRVVFSLDGLLSAIFHLFAPILDFIYSLLNIITLGVVPANVVGENLNWLSFALIESVAMMSIWRRVGFDVLILLAGLKSIPSSLYEAAEIDGHGGWSKFRNITLPMLKGPLGVVMVLELINGWQIFQEFYGLNIAQYGGDHTLAIYLISNYARPAVMTFASTVGYFIFGMTAFLGLLGRFEIKNLLKGFSLFSLLAILFSIPSNRFGLSAKSLGFSVTWLTYDLLFLVLAFICLAYYFIFSLLKYKQLEDDVNDLRTTGFFISFVVPFYLFNGYDVITQSGAGSTLIWFIPSSIIGLILLVIAILMLLAPRITSYFKQRQDPKYFASSFSFLFRQEDNDGV
jgi:ABC-type sugar transport system permease subunit